MVKTRVICVLYIAIPRRVRPSIKHDAQQRSEDDISHIIVNIIKANKTLQDKISQNANTNVIDDWTTVLQYYVATMVDNKIPGVASVAQRIRKTIEIGERRLVWKDWKSKRKFNG